MKNIFKKKPKTENELDKELRLLLRDMDRYRHDEEVYARYAESYERLYKLRQEDKKSTCHKVDVNTLITAGASLSTVLLILNYEKVNIITTKAGQFMKKW